MVVNIFHLEDLPPLSLLEHGTVLYSFAFLLRDNLTAVSIVLITIEPIDVVDLTTFHPHTWCIRNVRAFAVSTLVADCHIYLRLVNEFSIV